MKTMKIAVSRELVSTVSTHREKVTLDNTDFTDVAAVVITLAESRSGILALLKRTGFHLPVYLFSQEPTDVPDGATAVISGKAQEFLELESAASRYEENLLPPFFDTLSQYVAMGNSTLPVRATSTGRFSKNTRRDDSSMTSLVRTFFAPICAMPT